MERVFLVTGTFEATEAMEIQQGYLAIDPPAEVRIRRVGDRRRLTIKSGSGMSRREENFDIPGDVFERLWPLTEGRRVLKRRSIVHAAGHEIEVDEFEGHLDGLVLAEIEFADEDQARRFTPLPWMGLEVTEDTRYTNASLAVHGRPTDR